MRVSDHLLRGIGCHEVSMITSNLFLLVMVGEEIKLFGCYFHDEIYVKVLESIKMYGDF